MPPSPAGIDAATTSQESSGEPRASSAPTAPPAKKGRTWTLLKWTLTVLLLSVVLWRLPLADLAARLGQIRPSQVLVLVAIATVQVALSTARWWRLLRRLGERVSYAAAFGDSCVGILYNFLLPGSVGGDVVRALRMRARVARPHRAWSTSILERIVGLFAMATLASVAAVAGVDASLPLPGWLRYGTFALTLGLAAAFVFASLPFRLLVRFVGHRLPEVARVDLAGVGEDLAGPLTTLSVRAEVFGWSLVYQISSFVFVIACASALGAPNHVHAILIGVPMIYVLSLVPITVGGHGLREGLYVGILGALGMPGEVALALSGAFVVSTLLFSGVGGLFLAFDAPRAPRSRPPTA
ncbi:MAG: flippase-like domain-containing protein [Labilithrix sp.]|nr:flippase-like domain-containing protein [Labilithrix sp.]